MTSDVDGVQISVVNVANEVKSVRAGVTNIARKIDGVPIGLVNYTYEGEVHAVRWGSNIGVKFVLNDYLYSIISVGHGNQFEDEMRIVDLWR